MSCLQWMVTDCLRRDPVFASTLQSSLPSSTTSEIALLKSSAVPLLILHGSSERLVKVEFLEKLAKELPNVYKRQVVEIVGSGHTPSWEKPEEFGRAMAEFAESVFGPA